MSTLTFYLNFKTRHSFEHEPVFRPVLLHKAESAHPPDEYGGVVRMLLIIFLLPLKQESQITQEKAPPPALPQPQTAQALHIIDHHPPDRLLNDRQIEVLFPGEKVHHCFIGMTLYPLCSQ